MLRNNSKQNLLLQVHGENAEDDEDVNVWEDNWDDDTVEDDFSNQLRSELERLQHVKGR